MATPNTTLSVKVSSKFAKEFRSFCDKHFLQIGKFAEHALLEIMEDYHFGKKAQSILSKNDKELTSHKNYLEK